VELMMVEKAATSGGRAGRRVFDAAADLFYRKGIHAVGVEEIVRQAGVAKISLYRSFDSKDDLVLAYLEDRERDFLGAWDQMFDPLAAAPREQLRAIMTYVTERTTEAGYRGCPFINFSAEFPDPAHPGRVVAARIKWAIRERFRRLATALGAPRPDRLADGLLLLFEGAYALSQTLAGASEPPMRAILWAAEALVDAELGAAEAQPR
jgi:AcrR family transcriptional regulator